MRRANSLDAQLATQPLADCIALCEPLLGRGQDSQQDNSIFAQKAANLFKVILPPLIYQRDQHQKPLTLASLYALLTTNQVVALAWYPDLPSSVTTGLREVIGDRDQPQDQYIYAKLYLERMIHDILKEQCRIVRFFSRIFRSPRCA